MLSRVTKAVTRGGIRAAGLGSSSTRAFGAVPGTYLPADEVTGRVMDVMRTIKSVPPTADAAQSFSELGFDSLIRKDFWTKLEDEFCVEIAEKDASAFKSAADASAFIAKHPKAR